MSDAGRGNAGEEMDGYTVVLIKQLRLIRDNAVGLARQVDVTLTMLGDPLAGGLGGKREEPPERRAFMQREDALHPVRDVSSATGRDLTDLIRDVAQHAPPYPEPDADGATRTPLTPSDIQ